MKCIGCGSYTRYEVCDDCEKALDIWLAKQPEREQARREALDSAGYYDGDPNWRENLKAQRRANV